MSVKEERIIRALCVRVHERQTTHRHQGKIAAEDARDVMRCIVFSLQVE